MGQTNNTMIRAEADAQFYSRLGIHHNSPETLQKYLDWSDKVTKDISRHMPNLSLKARMKKLKDEGK